MMKKSFSRHSERTVLAVVVTILLVHFRIEGNGQHFILLDVELLDLVLTEDLEEQTLRMLLNGFQYILLALPVPLVRRSLLGRNYNDNLTLKFHFNTMFIWLNNNIFLFPFFKPQS